MELKIVPLIVVICYIVGELLKQCLKKKKKYYAFIPVILSIIGATISLLILYTYPNYINTDNFWVALFIGIISGLSSTGTNQIIKQLKKIME